MELGGPDILREVAGLEVRSLRILDELPQEQTALLRCDYAAQFTRPDGSQGIVIVEFQTRWEEDKILDFVAYAVQRMRRHPQPVVPVMLLFNPHPAARDIFQRGPILGFQFRLVKVWEIEVSHLLESRQPWLWALSPPGQRRRCGGRKSGYSTARSRPHADRTKRPPHHLCHLDEHAGQRRRAANSPTPKTAYDRVSLLRNDQTGRA